MPFLTSHRQAILVAILLTNFIHAQTCHYPDGTLSGDVPCDSTQGESSCCGSTSFCLSDGLCLNGNIVSRASCTDRTWSSEACAAYCTTGEMNPDVFILIQTLTGHLAVEDRGEEVALTPCTSGGHLNTFACGANTTDCQSDSNTFLIPSDPTIVLRPSQIAELLQTALASSTPSTSPSSSGSFSGGELAAVGCGVGLPLILALAVVVFLLKKEQRTNSTRKEMYQVSEGTRSEFSFRPPPPVPHRPSLPASWSSLKSPVSGTSTPSTPARTTISSSTQVRANTRSTVSHSRPGSPDYEAPVRTTISSSTQVRASTRSPSTRSAAPHSRPGSPVYQAFPPIAARISNRTLEPQPKLESAFAPTSIASQLFENHSRPQTIPEKNEGLQSDASAQDVKTQDGPQELETPAEDIETKDNPFEPESPGQASERFELPATRSSASSSTYSRATRVTIEPPLFIPVWKDL